MIERRITEGYVEQRGEDEKRIGGLAAVYYDGTPGTEFHLFHNAYERILPGAFDRAIREDDVRALFNHDPSHVLGRVKSGTLTLRSNSRGLEYEVDPGDTSIANDLRTWLRRGDVTGSSFGFTSNEDRWVRDGDREIRELVDVRLYDVSTVTFPAYSAATSELRGLRECGSYLAFLERQEEEMRQYLQALENDVAFAGAAVLTDSWQCA